MTVGNLEEILALVKDKDTPVLVPANGVFISACLSDTGLGDSEDEPIFVIMPCYCHIDENATVNVKADENLMSVN